MTTYLIRATNEIIIVQNGNRVVIKGIEGIKSVKRICEIAIKRINNKETT